MCVCVCVCECVCDTFWFAFFSSMAGPIWMKFCMEVLFICRMVLAYMLVWPPRPLEAVRGQLYFYVGNYGLQGLDSNLLM